MIPIPFSYARFYLPSAPPGLSSLPRTPSKLRKCPEPDKVSSRQTKKGAVKKLLKKPRVLVGACKSVLTKVHEAEGKHTHAQSSVCNDTTGVVPASDDISADIGESEGANGDQDLEIRGEQVDGIEVEKGFQEEEVPASVAVSDIPGIQPSCTDGDSIGCILGIGHGILDVERPQENPETETSAPVLDTEVETIGGPSEEATSEGNVNAPDQTETFYPEDIPVVAEQASDSSTTIVAPVEYANACTTTDDLSYVSALLDTCIVATSIDVPVDAHNEVSIEVNAEPYVRPLFGLRATDRSLVDESTQQTRSDDMPGTDISNLRANLRRTGRSVGNENEGACRRSSKGKGAQWSTGWKCLNGFYVFMFCFFGQFLFVNSLFIR
ncbi:hypothetical protein NLI96_g5345 [Meripilus lineatus]|uniref:Uncharacterized protein n=1 Tax=Meripilus lineatus TaxID=2056292 RepID=A0AAD5YJ34_9APHY|nr:hypothetical protein NLI96_g5345 [Physisporinus lineatus]